MNRSWKVLFETVLTKPLLRYYHEGYRTKPFVRNLLAIIFWKVSYWTLYTKPSWLFPVKVRYWTLHTKPFERFGLKVSYGTLCTKPILPFAKKKFHTKPSFGETTKGSERVPADRSFFGFVKHLFFYSVAVGKKKEKSKVTKLKRFAIEDATIQIWKELTKDPTYSLWFTASNRCVNRLFCIVQL